MTDRALAADEANISDARINRLASGSFLVANNSDR
jgi:hypothetical protein